MKIDTVAEWIGLVIAICAEVWAIWRIQRDLREDDEVVRDMSALHRASVAKPQT